MTGSMGNVTTILSQIESGDLSATDQLLAIVYDELRKLAQHKLAQETPGQTLQPTALVHEAFLRLIGSSDWNSRGHFFGAAAEAMRRILIENARRKKAIRHGGDKNRIDFETIEISQGSRSIDLLSLDEALDQLSEEEPQVAEVVKLRYFVGLTIDETASSLDISVRTANRHWAYAKAWLFERLSNDDS